MNRNNQKIHIKFKVNATIYELDVLPNETLLEILRERIELTGTKIGCGEGECGACTVHINGIAVNSCLVLAPEIDGAEITTIEGIAKDNKLHPVQSSFIEEGAIQCGYCTPGMIMSAVEFLNRNPNPDEDSVREAIAGNICRCTGYEKIIDAILKAANGMKQKRIKMIKEAVKRKKERARKKAR